MSNPGRKAEIRKVAAQVFAEKGFDRASIRDVAKAAEMSLAGLYYYYRGKDEILYDIETVAFSTLLDQHAEALAGVHDPEEKLDCVIRAHLDFFTNSLPEMKVMVRESDQLAGKHRDDVTDLKRRYVRLVCGILEELGKQTPLKDIPIRTSAFLLFGMMNWLYTWYHPERDGGPEVLARAVREIFLSGITR